MLGRNARIAPLNARRPDHVSKKLGVLNVDVYCILRELKDDRATQVLSLLA